MHIHFHIAYVTKSPVSIHGLEKILVMYVHSTEERMYIKASIRL